MNLQSYIEELKLWPWYQYIKLLCNVHIQMMLQIFNSKYETSVYFVPRYTDD